MFSYDRAAIMVPLGPPGMILHYVAGVDVDRLHVAVAWHKPGIARLAAVQTSVVLEHHLNRFAQGGNGSKDDISHLPIVLDHEVIASTLILESSSLPGKNCASFMHLA